eukprot:PhM_4_TR3044/c2_g7_i1/m.45557
MLFNVEEKSLRTLMCLFFVARRKLSSKLSPQHKGAREARVVQHHGEAETAGAAKDVQPMRSDAQETNAIARKWQGIRQRAPEEEGTNEFAGGGKDTPRTSSFIFCSTAKTFLKIVATQHYFF